MQRRWGMPADQGVLPLEWACWTFAFDGDCWLYAGNQEMLLLQLHT